jgi:anti-sigma regulatory factor (Ser/Thr protein kinase)
MERSFERDFRALGEIFEFTGRFAAAHRIDESLSFSIHLVVEELFTNMVKYNTGAGHPIRIRLNADDRKLCVELVDEDVDPWDPDEAPDVRVDRPIEERRAGGLGLYLVRSIADKLTYEYENRRMKITVIKNLER